jgi:hypothetical protein
MQLRYSVHAHMRAYTHTHNSRLRLRLQRFLKGLVNVAKLQDLVEKFEDSIMQCTSIITRVLRIAKASVSRVPTIDTSMVNVISNDKISSKIRAATRDVTEQVKAAVSAAIELEPILTSPDVRTIIGLIFALFLFNLALRAHCAAICDCTLTLASRSSEWTAHHVSRLVVT